LAVILNNVKALNLLTARILGVPGLDHEGPGEILPEALLYLILYL